MCDEVVVLMLDEWRENVGVQAEIRIAGEVGKEVAYLEPTFRTQELIAADCSG